MALHDVDKGGDQRTAPSLNQNDQMMQRVAASVTSINPVTEETPSVYQTPTPGTFRVIATDTFSFVPADFSSSGNAYLTEVAMELISHAGVTAPIVLVFLENALAERILLPYYAFDPETGDLNYSAIAEISDTETRVSVRSTAALSPGVTFRYYICQQTASGS